eukprot:scaffold6922_cov363-Prasinococcus_capsulatus_cf.AAC.7
MPGLRTAKGRASKWFVSTPPWTWPPAGPSSSAAARGASALRAVHVRGPAAPAPAAEKEQPAWAPLRH